MKKNLLSQCLKNPLLLVLPLLFVFQTAMTQNELAKLIQLVNGGTGFEIIAISSTKLQGASPCGVSGASIKPSGFMSSLENFGAIADQSRYLVMNSDAGPLDIKVRSDYANIPLGFGRLACSLVDPVDISPSNEYNLFDQNQFPNQPIFPTLHLNTIGFWDFTFNLDVAIQKNPTHNHVKLLVIQSTDPATSTWTVMIPVLITGSWGEKRGQTSAPLLPTMVVHDPPGDASYASIANGTNTCHGYGAQVQSSTTQDYSASVKIGASATVGLFVTTEISASITATAGVEMGLSETSDKQYEICYDVTESFTTPPSGESDDLFIGAAIVYDYGFYNSIRYNQSTCKVEQLKDVGLQPRSQSASFFYTESFIRNNLIPDYTAQKVAAQNSGQPDLANQFGNQIKVLEQALAKNDAIKNAAVLQTTKTFNGGPGFDYTATTTTSMITNIETELYVEPSFAVEAAVEVGGSGVSSSVGMKARFGSGSNSSASNTNTNTISYHLQDDDGSDLFDVGVYGDPVYGTPIFKLNPASMTSCPYEGGIQLDQPHLAISNSASNTINVTAAPGSPAVFKVDLCNNSPVSRTYYLKLNASSNLSGAVVKAAGTTLNGNDLGQQYAIPANGCLQNLVITVEQGASPVEEYPNLEIFLYTLCEEDYTPQHSNILATAFFGQVPANDLACNAILVPANGIAQMGYSNAHATVSSNEAMLTPSTNDCINSWCENGSNQITNSVWFKFVAPSSGSVEVSTCGLTDLDTQIATYSATDCNNFSSYTLLGANDDRVDACGANLYDSKMTLNNLTPGVTYYVIVDGWNGATGTFGIKLTDAGTIAVKETVGEASNLSVSPNPTSGQVFIRLTEQNIDAFTLAETTGRMVRTGVMGNQVQTMDMDLTTLPKGVYVLQVRSGNQLFSRKIVLQ